MTPRLVLKEFTQLNFDDYILLEGNLTSNFERYLTGILSIFSVSPQ